MSRKSIHPCCGGQQTRLPKTKCHWRCIVFRAKFVALEVITVVYVRTSRASLKKTRHLSADCCSEVRWQSRNLYPSHASKKGPAGLSAVHSGMGVEGMLPVRTNRRKFSIAAPSALLAARSYFNGFYLGQRARRGNQRELFRRAGEGRWPMAPCPPPTAAKGRPQGSTTCPFQ
jgi:hypothetical protein